MSKYFAKYAQPAKLFLCSRDIQVGDKPYTPKGIQHNEPTVHIDECKVLSKQGWFKVIGEISKEATWVQEGQEFDEEEISISKYPLCPKCGAISNDGFCPEDRECQIEKKRKVIKIKGLCGHFH